VAGRQVILLDTNYLIQALVKGSAEAERILAWFEEDESLVSSSVVWYEFVSGPVDEEGVEIVRMLLRDRILPYTADQATESARLYNAAGRPRHLRIDAMIAAAAIVTNARLATANRDDFKAFESHGLRLV
jgi:predicted nucleic acid-binding protein